MTSECYIDRVHRERQRLRDEYGDLFDRIVAILFRHDPASINFETNTDEYAPEARTILSRLEGARSADDTARIVREEFALWFGPNSGIRADRCQSAADEIWQAWYRRAASQSQSDQRTTLAE